MLFLILLTFLISCTNSSRYPKPYTKYEKEVFTYATLISNSQENDPKMDEELKKAGIVPSIRRLMPFGNKKNLKVAIFGYNDYPTARQKLYIKRVLEEINDIWKTVDGPKFEIISEIYGSNNKSDFIKAIDEYNANLYINFGELIYGGNALGIAFNGIPIDSEFGFTLVEVDNIDTAIYTDVYNRMINIFRHEMLHAVGFEHTNVTESYVSHFFDDASSFRHEAFNIELFLFTYRNQGYLNIDRYPDIDRTLIEMLYNPELMGKVGPNANHKEAFRITQWKNQIKLNNIAKVLSHIRRPDRRSKKEKAKYPIAKKEEWRGKY